MAKRYSPLRLVAASEHDIPPLSAVLQDALVRSGDIRVETKARAVTVFFNRFVWETSRWLGPHLRVRSVLHIGEALHVRSRNLPKADTIHASEDAPIFALLSVTFEPDAEPPGGVVTLTFAGDRALQITVDALDIRLADDGTPWRARSRPKHRPGHRRGS